MKISMRVTKNTFPTLAARIPQRTHEVVADSLARVRDGAAQRSHVDTGELRDSWSVSFTGPTDGQVASSSGHAVYNEYGTVHMSAQPLLAPAIDQERPRFVAELSKLVSELG